MGNRLSKIYTRTGDRGTTGLGDGSRIAKDAARIEAIGAVDELNSALGVLLAQEVTAEVASLLTGAQHTLFDLGGELSLPNHTAISEQDVAALETALDGFNNSLPPLKEFILPGGGPAATACHLARAICRRAERRLVSLGELEALNPQALAYLNRLSDLLFVTARVLARASGAGEVLWKRENRNHQT